MAIKFAINGFGRIGKSVLRVLAERRDHNMECVVVNCGSSGDLKSQLHLFKYDSTHGHTVGVSQIDDSTFELNGHKIKAIFENDVSKINWAELGVDVVMDCTGKFTSRDKAMQHIQSGAKKVMISAPADSADATIVYGVNHSILSPMDQIISIGSCTTNCLSPIAKILNDEIGIESGFMTTIHAYTNDQVLLDGYHSDLRRARSASASMIPTSTGAAKAIGLVIPELNGKLDGVAVRVPVQNVSMIEFVFNAAKDTSVDQINSIISAASKVGPMSKVLSYNDEPLVSVDFNHSPYSSIFDSTLTKVIGGRMCKVSAWYDNEWGFSNRMLDVLNLLGNYI